jgi:hypothetical protein
MSFRDPQVLDSIARPGSTGSVNGRGPSDEPERFNEHKYRERVASPFGTSSFRAPARPLPACLRASRCEGTPVRSRSDKRLYCSGLVGLSELSQINLAQTNGEICRLGEHYGQRSLPSR